MNEAELIEAIEKLTHERDAAIKIWQEYERDYILPCFRWAKELGIDLQELVYANPGKNCVELLVGRLRDREALLKESIQNDCTLETCGHLRQLDAIVDLLGVPRGTCSVLDWLRSHNLSHHELVQACRNIEYDLTCGQCKAVFFTGTGTYPHDPTCSTGKDDATTDLQKKV